MQVNLNKRGLLIMNIIVKNSQTCDTTFYKDIKNITENDKSNIELYDEHEELVGILDSEYDTVII
jgi:hypothetical protein